MKALYTYSFSVAIDVGSRGRWHPMLPGLGQGMALVVRSMVVLLPSPHLSAEKPERSQECSCCCRLGLLLPFQGPEQGHERVEEDTRLKGRV